MKLRHILLAGAFCALSTLGHANDSLGRELDRQRRFWESYNQQLDAEAAQERADEIEGKIDDLGDKLDQIESDLSDLSDLGEDR